MNLNRFIWPLFFSLGLQVLSAQPADNGARQKAAVPRKRAPLLLADQAMAGMKPELRARALAAAKGRPAIAVGKRRYIVMLREEAGPAAFAKDRGITCERTFIHALKGFVCCLDDATVDSLRDAPEVEGIEEDRPTAEVSSQTVPTGVKRMAVEQFPTAKINGLDERVDVDVAVVDTGVQPDHPDLNVYRTASMLGGYSGDEHGTAVAGVIGALDNDIGTVGVAPGVRIWAVDIGTGTSIYSSERISGFDYVAEHADEIEVMNCSIGTFYGQSHLRSYEEDVVRNLINKGVVVVCAAMNDSGDIAGPNGVLDDGEITDNTLPAALPESMAVSAVSPVFDQFASYSNFSATNHNNRRVFSPGAAIDVAAPTGVYTTAMNSSYWFGFNGTSCAAPHVVGLVALYIAKHGRATDAEGVYRIRQAIVDAAQPQSTWQTDNTLDPDSNPEGMAVASPAWLDPAPKITRFEKFADRVEVEASTLPGYLHTLEESPTLGIAEAWNGGDPVQGNGAPVTFIHHPAGPRNFYRLGTRAVPWPQIDPVAISNLGSTGLPGNGLCYLSNRIPGSPLAADASGQSLSQTLFNYGGGMKVPWLSEMTPAGPFSVEVWVRPARNTAMLRYSARFVAARETGGRGWSLNQYPSSSASNPNGFSFTLATGGTSSVVPSVAMAVNVNKWYHVAGVFDGANTMLYVDGSLVQSVPVPSGQSYLPPLEAGICFGSDLGERWFEGRLDEAAFYPRALTAAQVLSHYQSGISASPPIPYQQVILGDNPAGYWRFNEP